MAKTEVSTVAVIGTGTIGASWASLFLAHGHSVRCADPSPDAEPATRRFVERAWPALAALGPVPDLDTAQHRLSFHAEIGTAVAGVGFVQENAPERLELKQRLLAEIEAALAPEAIIASSTSGIMPSAMQAGMLHPERFLVGHPFNPPHLLPLVEVVGGLQTSPASIALAMEFYQALGKRVIHVRKEVSGHVANRLQAALWREAVHLAVEGVASVADIDAAVVAGPGLRWALMGPHKTFHLAGGQGGMAHFVDHLGPAFESWWADLGTPVLDAASRDILVQGIAQEVGPQTVEALVEVRDAGLLGLLASIKPLS